MQHRQTLVIGSRGSQLALLQAQYVGDALEQAHPNLDVRIQTITTKADKMLDAPLAKIGDKGLFIKELEQALVEGRIDLAVHSAKDVPTQLPEGLTIAAITEREQVHDVFVGPYGSLDEIPQRCVVGSSSLRRRSQLLAIRPDLRLVDIRGNVQTRMRKLEEGAAEGTVLAAAGLNRLERQDLIAFTFELDVLLPAVGQGALAVEIRADDQRARELLAVVHHEPTATELSAERTLMRELEGGCQVPIGGLAELDGERMAMRAFVGSLDGRQILRARREGPAADPEKLALDLVRDLMDQGAGEILADVRRSAGVAD